MDKRLRGRAGMAQRERRLRAEPLCRSCKAMGVIRAADEVDHILALALGGSDTDANCQSLCSNCHAFKSAFDNASAAGGAVHPDWLKPSRVPLTIVCGPPCAGKSTFVAARAEPTDLVVDLDLIRRSLDPDNLQWAGGLDKDLLSKCLRVRNSLLGSLAHRSTGKAWLIVSAPTQAERKWWQAKLGGEVILIHPGIAECKRRALVRDTPLAADGVDLWERAARSPWVPKEAAPQRQAIGVDGWPTPNP